MREELTAMMDYESRRLDDEILAQRIEIRNLTDENAELKAELERLRADRAALIGLWVFPNGGRWQVRSESVPPPVYATREEAEAAVLEWARGRKG